MVGALAVDPDGTLYVETGRPSEGLVLKVGRDGSMTRLVTGAARAAPNAPISSASVVGPTGRLIADGAGGVVVATDTRIIDVTARGSLRTIAGTAGVTNPSGAAVVGDGGPALKARFTAIRALASDDSGNIFVAEAPAGSRAPLLIRVINRTDHPLALYRGTPWAMTIAPGHVDTIAGVSGVTTPGDGGPARRAALVGEAVSMAARGGELYVATYLPKGTTGADAQVRLIDLAGGGLVTHGTAIEPGGIRTIARGSSARSGEAGQERDLSFAYVPGMAVDSADSLYLADELHQRIRRIDRDGRLTTIAGAGQTGDGEGGFNGNEQPAVRARLNRPHDVKLDAAGDVYISDQLNGEVRFIDPGGRIHAAPGGGMLRGQSCAGHDARTSGARGPGGPIGVVADGSGEGIVVEADENRVRRFAADGTVTTVAGILPGVGECPTPAACAGAGGDGGPALRARFDSPSAVALTPRRDIYVLDSGNARVRFINRGSEAVPAHGRMVAPGTVVTVAGTGSPGAGGDDGPAVRAQLAGLGSLATIPGTTEDRLLAGDAADHADAPAVLGSLAASPTGDLFIADTANHRVRQVDGSGRITTIAGQGAPPGREACCTAPRGLAIDGRGNLYVSDLFTNRVWLINRGPRPARALGQTVEPETAGAVAGDGTLGLSGDAGPAMAAQLLNPSAIALDARGRLFIAESRGKVGDLRQVDADGKITTVVGSGGSVFNGDGLPGRRSAAGLMTGLSVDSCGNLLFTDLSNDRVRRLNLEAACAQRVLSNGVIASPAAAPPGALMVAAAVVLITAATAVSSMARGRRRLRTTGEPRSRS